jgi:preprotein translocase subunit SecF
MTGDLLVNANYDFMGNRKKFYIFSSIVIVAGMAVLIGKGGLSTGIDFKGGYGYQMQLEKGINVEKIKTALDKGLKGSSNEVKTIGSEGRYKIVTTYKINEAKVSADDSAAVFVSPTAFPSAKIYFFPPFAVSSSDLIKDFSSTFSSGNEPGTTSQPSFFNFLASFLANLIDLEEISFLISFSVF